MKIALIALCFCIFGNSTRASGWYEEKVPKGSDLYSVEFKWKEWPPGTYFAFWNGSLYPKGGTYYGGLPSGPGKTEKDYHPGLIWSFWNHRDYDGDIARAIYTDPTMYAHQYGGEGMCGGIAGDRLPWIQRDTWYRMLLRVWRPVNGTADHSFIGWWCKDLKANKWRLLGVFQVPCVATGIGGNVGFLELLSEKKSRRFLARRNGYHRHNGKWGHSNTMTVKADASHTWQAELSADKRVAEFMHSKNPEDTHNVEPGSKKTISVSQPPQPVLDRPQVKIMECVAYGEQTLLRWEIPGTASPQLSYTVSIYDGENGEGNVLSTLSRNIPFKRIDLLGESQRGKSLKLSVTDIYGQSVSATSNLNKAVSGGANKAVQKDQLQPGLRYKYYESKDMLHELAFSDPDTAKKRGTVNTFDIHLAATKNFSVTYDGMIKVEKTGLYYFDLKSCDGSQLYIGGKRILDNNGLHSTSNVARGQFLSQGFHSLKLRYFKGANSRYRELSLFWAGPEMAYRQVDHGDLFSRSDKSPVLTISTDRLDGRYTLRATFTNNELPITKIEYFRADQRLGESVAHEVLTRNNVAKGSAVSHSGLPENGTAGWQSCDNQLGSTFFMSGQKDNWILFDLGTVETLDKVFTRFYEDGKRFYTYTVEVSADKTNWQTVAGRRSEEPEQPHGNLHNFDAAKARYIRLSDIMNSANSSIHLAELMAFPKGKECFAEPYALTTLLPEGENRVWARATDSDGNTFDSNLMSITANNIEKGALTSETLGEKGLPMGLVNATGSYCYIGEGRCLSYKKVTGDFRISARLKDNPRASTANKINNNSWIGLCVMDEVNEHWPVAAIYDTAGYELKGSADFSDLGGTRLTQHRFNGANSWVRLEREGKFIRCYSSPDGKKWQKEADQYTRHLRETVVTGVLFRTIPYLNKTLYSAAVDKVTITPLTSPTSAVKAYVPNANEVTQLEADPRSHQTLYARSLSKILTSKDGGSNWSIFLENFDGEPLQAMALEARAPYRMAIGTNNGVYMATNPGQGFKPYTLAGDHITALSFVKNDDRLVVAIGQQQSEIVRIQLSNKGQQKLGLLDDILVHHISYDPREENGLHLATQSGLYGTWNNLHSLFQRHAKNLNTTSHGNIATDRPNRVTYILNRNPDDSLSLCQSNWGVQYKKITDSSFASSTPITGFLKLAGENHFLLCNKEGIFRSTDGAKNFRRVYSGPGND
jgi:hypothetical protein